MPDYFVHDFREAAPYIHYLRGKTLVLGIDGSLLQGAVLGSIAADLNLLAALGIRLVLVHGSDWQNHSVIDETALQIAKQTCGQVQFDFQAALSLGFAHSPQRAPRLRVLSGNWITAKPLGIINGVDSGYAGQVRKIDAAAIHDALAQSAIVLMSPIGSSLSGQCYHLEMSETAQKTAVALRAEKLIFLTEWDGIINQNNEIISEMTASEAERLAQYHSPQHAMLTAAVQALRSGVSRVQVLSGKQNGGLLRELFTRDGVGTSIANTPFMTVRDAQEFDIADIISLIRPLEAQGVLMYRSQEYLAKNIHQFNVLENDRQIYGCVMLKTFAQDSDTAELACLVVSPHAREGGYGDLLLQHIISKAKKLNYRRLLALSTHTSDWFAERGFQAAGVNDLPPERLAEYQSSGRQSKIFIMDL